MAQLEHIEAIEKRLWSAADTGRSGSLGTVMYVSSDFWPLPKLMNGEVAV